MTYIESKDTFAKLPLIMKRARENPTYQFTCLAHLLNAEFLKACTFSCETEHVRIDDDMEEYGEKDENLNDLVTPESQAVQTATAKRVYIPKNNTRRTALTASIGRQIVQKDSHILEAPCGISLLYG